MLCLHEQYLRSAAYTKKAMCALRGVCYASKDAFFRLQKEKKKLRKVWLHQKPTARAPTPQMAPLRQHEC